MPTYGFVECLERFLMDSRQHKPATTDRNRCAARHLKRYFYGLYVSGEFWRIDGATVTRYREERKGAGASPLCVKRELAVASAAVNYCRSELDWELQNPFEKRMISKADSRMVRRHKRIITLAEEASILLASPPLLRDVIRFALLTGMRQGEILGLEWDRVIGDTVIFSPEHQKSGKYGKRALSAEALEIIHKQPSDCPLVFHVDQKRIRKETVTVPRPKGRGFPLHHDGDCDARI